MLSDKKILCGVDLGGTKLAVGLVTPKGGVLDRTVVYDHLQNTEKEVCRRIGECVRVLLKRNTLEETDLLGIGVGFPGHIRYREGVAVTSSNFRNFTMKNFPLRSMVQEQFETDIAVITDNDANAQAMAEFLFGAGRAFETMIFITISTGIGAGLVLDGRLYRGISGTAGEIGHTIVNPFSTIKCGCGNYGCLMSHACGLSICEAIREKQAAGMNTVMPVDACTCDEEMDGKLILNGLVTGDAMAIAIMEEYGDYIGIGLYNLFQIFNPPVIVLGGGLLNWGEPFLDRIRKKFHTLVRDMMHDEMKIEPTEIGPDAGLLGAAALLLESTE